jgi:hypothetical protein
VGHNWGVIKDGRKRSAGETLNGPDLIADFHTYGVLWTGTLDAGAQDHWSGGAARGAGSGYRRPRRATCPVDGIIWGKVRDIGCDGDSGIARRAEARSDQTEQRQRRVGSWPHGLRSGEPADENQPPLAAVPTDHRLNWPHRFCIEWLKRRGNRVLRRIKLGGAWSCSIGGPVRRCRAASDARGRSSGPCGSRAAARAGGSGA